MMGWRGCEGWGTWARALLGAVIACGTLWTATAFAAGATPAAPGATPATPATTAPPGAPLPGTSAVTPAPEASGALSEPHAVLFDPFLGDLEERTFRFFWETANPQNGLIPDRYPSPSFASIAAVGFGLTAYPIGVERGYITRVQARQRVLTTLRFFLKAPNEHGFYYHFMDMKTGERANDSEVSTVDTALLLAG
ncbi:MAG TPA: hypothetical protein VKB72_14950, partial [Steroidobacteraceae bacterium]|nr:hypothetical protein [Steroidobacteraceae bacterium]